MTSLFRRLRGHEDGATIIEFAFILPTFLLMLLGTFDIAYQVFLRATLSGAVQAAARESALETGPTRLSVIDQRVELGTYLHHLN